MVTLYDQEKVMEIHDYNVARAAEQRGIAEGMERGIAQEAENGVRTLVHTLQELGIERNVAAEQLERQLGLSAETAEKKLTEYWKS